VIVVSDTSPLFYLLLIGEIDLLPALFGTVLIPEAVTRELRHAGVPTPVKQWVVKFPPWLQVRAGGPEGSDSAPRLAALDDGEREAIQLAYRLDGDLVVLDDKAARVAAAVLGLKVTGTLGILDTAARRGLVDLPAAVARLQRTNFRAAPALLQWLLARNP
jgi:predicted nucleic acid-binding protein